MSFLCNLYAKAKSHAKPRKESLRDDIEPGGWGWGGTWVNLCWVCATGLSEPLPHYSHILWPIIDPILVTFG